MITIYFNEHAIQCVENLSLADALIQQGYQASYFAVAINQHFIARSQYQTTYLQPQDKVEIVSPLQGG